MPMRQVLLPTLRLYKSPRHCRIESSILHASLVHIESPMGSHAEPATRPAPSGAVNRLKLWRQRRPRREHRRDFVPPPAGASDRVEPARRQTSSVAGQHEGGPDIHGRLQHGPWPAGRAGADRAREQDRRRLAGEALTRAHSSRHVRERLGNDDCDPAARGQVVLCFIPPRSTSYLQPCVVAVFRIFKSCIQTQASATLARSVLDGTFDDVVMNKAWRRQSSAEGASRAVTDLCEKKQAWTAGWRRFREAGKGQRAARHWRPVRKKRSNQSPLPKTWTQAWQRHQTTKTTRPRRTRQHRVNLS